MTKTTNTDQTVPNIDITSPYTPRRPAPIFSISMNNPLGTALRKIKNFLVHKQTLFATTFTIKVTPIVAIVSLAGVAALFGGGITTAYNFGKTVEQKFLTTTPTPTPKVVVQQPSVITTAKTGTVKATYQNPLTPPPTAIPTQPLGSDSGKTEPTPSPTSQPIMHYILVDQSGAITYLLGNINWSKYLNLRILATGNFDSIKNTFTITNSSAIEIIQ